jgi:hypothetical protein
MGKESPGLLPEFVADDLELRVRDANFLAVPGRDHETVIRLPIENIPDEAFGPVAIHPPSGFRRAECPRPVEFLGDLARCDTRRVALEDQTDGRGFGIVDSTLHMAIDPDVVIAERHPTVDVPGLGLPLERVDHVRPGGFPEELASERPDGFEKFADRPREIGFPAVLVVPEPDARLRESVENGGLDPLISREAISGSHEQDVEAAGIGGMEQRSEPRSLRLIEGTGEAVVHDRPPRILRLGRRRFAYACSALDHLLKG